MGQTQILFIVLAVIIVGIAVAVGITQFRSSAYEANKNAVAADLQSLSAQAELWYKKPASMGGGDRTFAGVPADSTGITRIGGNFQNANGRYWVHAVAQDQITLRGEGNEDGDGDGNNLVLELVYDATDPGNPVFTTIED
jgi:hypothetical protein